MRIRIAAAAVAAFVILAVVIQFSKPVKASAAGQVAAQAGGVF